MLALDSPRWSEITHAYGPATEVPGLLAIAAQLSACNSADDEPYFSLWSALCHQGDIYVASYAALPHLVGIVRSNPEREIVPLIDLVGAIETARLQGKGPSMPADLEAAYEAALAELPAIAGRLLVLPRNEEGCRVILAALAAAKGHPRLAEGIGELTSRIIEKLLNCWRFE